MSRKKGGKGMDSAYRRGAQCKHDWENYTDDYTYTTYYKRRCKKCGDVELLKEEHKRDKE